MDDQYTGVDDVEEMSYVNSEDSEYEMHDSDDSIDFNEDEPSEESEYEMHDSDEPSEESEYEMHDSDDSIHFNEDEPNQQPTSDNEVNEEESVFSYDYESPGGTPYWIPHTDEDIKPKVGSVYASYTAAENAYRKYALQAGFDVRLGSSNKKKLSDICLTRYFLCNREGKPNTGRVDTTNIKYRKIVRRKDMHRTECKAHIVFKLVPGTGKYIVHDFIESHNHILISKENMHFSRAKRQLDFSQKAYIFNMCQQNVGASKAHRLMSGMQGGYSRRGGLVTDYKNYSRNLNCFIGGRDAQLIVNLLSDRAKYAPDFTFDCRVDEDSHLNAMFWADETAKCNYKEFGDVISFDATFNTNRYNMIFVPFTGIDNHKRCVTFGAGLLSREDTDSYVWLLTCFINAFKKQPIIVLSDQDAAMKKAIRKVFPQSEHRLCMWHITTKLPFKIPKAVHKRSDFKKRFNSLIWNAKLDHLQFEAGWESMIKEFDLSDNKWLSDMYALRSHWIPAFFKDVPMCGLMRTTSLSESQNWSFTNSTLTGSYLLIFMSIFDSAMERQRHNQSHADFLTSQTYPKPLTYLTYEPHAARVYTRRIFFQVQEELFESEKTCLIKNLSSAGDIDTFVVLEKKKSISTRTRDNVDDKDMVEEYHFNSLTNDSDFKVTHNKTHGLLQCSCLHFEQVGLLCRHVFCVMRFCDYEKIPERYISRRWRRDIIPSELLRRRFKNFRTDGHVDQTAIDIFSTIDHCVSLLSADHVKLNEFLEEVTKLKTKFCDDSSSQPVVVNNNTHFEQVLGVTIPSEIEIENPADIKNKGCGSRGKRLTSKSEMLAVEAQKRKRICRGCNQPATHDKRNCPLKKK